MRLFVVPAVAGLTLAALTAVTSPASATADGCDGSTVVDFNGDGRPDAAVGDPSGAVGALDGAGHVIVRYGGTGGHIGNASSVRLTQSDVGSTSQAQARFGNALAAADQDCDGYTDLLVGVPGYDLAGGKTNAGMAVLIKGSSSGLGNGGGTATYTTASFGQATASGDAFGFSVDMIEDVGTGGTPDPFAYAFAIGAPYRDAGGQIDSGAVAFRNAGDGGNVGGWLTQDSAGFPGASEQGDAFGYSVALLYDGDDRTDLVVGSPGEDVVAGGGDVVDAGVITRIHHLYLDEYDSVESFSQNSSGVPDTVEAGDRFGHSLAGSRSGSTNYLAVGVPLENVGSKSDAGLVQLFTVAGSTITPKTGLTQNTSGVAGSAETNDHFGDVVDLALATNTYLAVGVPGENQEATNSGLVQVFKAASVSTDKSYTQDSSGVGGKAATNDAFGSSVALVSGYSEHALLVGVPSDNAYPNGLVHAIPYRGGSAIHQTWKGLAAGAADFGVSLATQGS